MLAEKREAAKDKLLAIAARESSAMANALLGWTQAFRRGFTSQSSREHALGLMEARIASHLGVLETLLDASGTSGVELSLVRLPLVPVLEETRLGQQAFAAERCVHLGEPTPLEGGAVVLADRGRIARAWGDLLAECIRAANVGSAVSVDLTSDASSAAVRLTVRDRRAALDEYSAGVAAARHAASVHLGTLESYEDGFVLRLPLFEPARAEATPARVKKMLIVRHDEPEIAEMIAALATGRPLQILTVHDEDLAARAFEVHAPDVVVVGSADGFERLRSVVEKSSGRIARVSSAAEASALVNSLTSERS